MVSGVMSVYNSGPYLEAQLDSIRTQSHPLDEMVFVDDGSTNGTAERIERYITSYGLSGWKVYRNEKNEGFVAGFRKALSLASGDVIFLADHDDVWMPDKVERMLERFARSPSMLALLSGYEEIDGEGEVVSFRADPRKSNHNLIRKRLKRGGLSQLTFADIAAYNAGPGCTAAIKKELVPDYLSISGSLPHDWALFALAAMRNGLYFLDVPLMQYRIHAGNTLGLPKNRRLHERWKHSLLDAAQKHDLVRLARQFGTDADLSYMDRVCSLFDRRAAILEKGDVSGCIRLLWDSRSVPFLYETVGMDLKAVLQK